MRIEKFNNIVLLQHIVIVRRFEGWEPMRFGFNFCLFFLNYYLVSNNEKIASKSMCIFSSSINLSNTNEILKKSSHLGKL